MISVSNDLKKAFKSRNREIKGYVEVLYDVQNIDCNISAAFVDSTHENIFSYSDITTNNRMIQNYASLDEDYFLLDGSFILPSKSQKNNDCGIQSSEVFSSIIDNRLKFLFINLNSVQKIRYLTIYTVGNILKDISLTYSSTTTTDGSGKTFEITGNTEQVINIDLGSYEDIKELEFYISEVENKNRRIRISHIDFGYTDAYYGKDLISFSIDEEISNTYEESPVNECSITVSNVNNKFDVLNENGIQKFLTKNAKIIPHVGALTENNGIEYIKMGEFYYYNFKNNGDFTTTLVGRNLMEKLHNELFVYDSNENDPFISFIHPENLSSRLPITYPKYEFEFDLYARGQSTSYSTFGVYLSEKEKYLSDFLLEEALANSVIFNCTRDNKIALKKRNENVVENITNDEISEDNISVDDTGIVYKIELTRQIVDNQEAFLENFKTISTVDNIILYDKETIIPIYVNNTLVTSNISLTYSGCKSAKIVGYSHSAVYVKIIGDIGSNVTITLKDANVKYSVSSIVTNIQKEGLTSGNTIKINNDIVVLTSPYKRLLNYMYRYNYLFEYNGLPYLEAGDYIEVETDYGNKKMIIEKSHFEYDGGLYGKIEGSGN